VSYLSRLDREKAGSREADLTAHTRQDRLIDINELRYRFVLPNDSATQAFFKLYNLAASLTRFQYDWF
jgi:hypothetical protein